MRSCFVYAGGSPCYFVCVMRGLRNFADSSDIRCEGVASSSSVCEDRIQDTIVMEI